MQSSVDGSALRGQPYAKGMPRSGRRRGSSAILQDATPLRHATPLEATCHPIVTTSILPTTRTVRDITMNMGTDMGADSAPDTVMA